MNPTMSRVALAVTVLVAACVLPARAALDCQPFTATLAQGSAGGCTSTTATQVGAAPHLNIEPHQHAHPSRRLPPPPAAGRALRACPITLPRKRAPYTRLPVSPSNSRLAEPEPAIPNSMNHHTPTHLFLPGRLTTDTGPARHRYQRDDRHHSGLHRPAADFGRCRSV
jgi:hypothetical protein